MKSFKGFNQGIQGDVALTRITALPGNAVELTAEKGQHVVAHSESGHNHVVAEREAKFYRDADDPLVAYLAVQETADLTHLRSFNTHETVQFDAGVYRINRQREYTPKGLRRVAD